MDEAQSDRMQSTAAASAPSRAKLAVRMLVEETSTSFGDGQCRFTLHELLGQGGFGSVYRCSAAAPQSGGSTSLSQPAESTSAAEEFAVKVIDAQRLVMLLGSTLEVVVPRLLREAEVLKTLGRHPHIVFLHEVFFSRRSNKLYLLHELLRGGDLFNAIVRRRRPFREADARTLLRQIAEAVLYGHRRGIAHRDLKMENCLLEDGPTLCVKVCDYGQAKFLRQDATAKTLTCSAAYTAPDVQLAVDESRSYDALKADAFALGVLLYGLLCNALPNAAKGAAYQSHAMWQRLTPGVKELIEALLAPEPGMRLSVEEALAHPWLSGATSGHSSPGGRSSTGGPEQELQVVLAAHQLVVAVQRERGNCVGAGGERFHWHQGFTDQRFAEFTERLSQLDDGEGPWGRVTRSLSDTRAALEALRLPATEAMGQSPRPPGAVERVMESYGRVVAAAMRILDSALALACPEGQRSVSGTVRHKVLMLAAEQLGRERALLCGYLRQPQSLTEPQTARRVYEVIGARKLLLGTARCGGVGGEVTPLRSGLNIPSVVVAGELGILPALELMQAPLLEPEELALLEDAEDRALTSTGAAPKLSEWYQLITGLVDKIHRHVVLNFVDHFPQREPEEVCIVDQLPKWGSAVVG